MQAKYSVALAAVASFGLGAAAMHALYAQAKPLAYVIAEIEVSNADAYAKEFIPAAGKAIEDAGGRFIVRGGKTKSLMGARLRKTALQCFTSKIWTRQRRGGILREEKTRSPSAINMRNSASMPLRV
jgi:uncharacterized protein (DUF1330 family)